MINRREILAGIAGVATAGPRATRAQQKAMPVVGVVYPASRPANWPANPDPRVSRVQEGLRETGFIDGQNVALEYRWIGDRYDRAPELIADLVGRKVDVIIVQSATAALAAKAATSTIPIVFSNVPDPVGLGLVPNLARPGGNLTGTTNGLVELSAKQIDLISEMVPRDRAIAILVNPDGSLMNVIVPRTQEASNAKGRRLLVVRARTAGEIDAAFTALAGHQAGGLMVAQDLLFDTPSARAQIIALAARHGIPAIYSDAIWTKEGGLMSYDDETSFLRLAAIYAGRILKGAKPADLPVQGPTTYTLSINLKTAKALGLTVPQSLLLRADEVIEAN